MEKIPDLPNVMDKANIALQMLAEGKLNLYVDGSKNIELEELKMKNMRNNILITGITGQVGSQLADYILENTDLDGINDTMKTGKIKSLFSKSMKGRITSRVLLNKFIEKVA